MLRGRDEDELVVEDGDERGVRVPHRTAHAEVHLVAEDHLEDLLGVAGAHADAHVRVRRPERLEQPRQEVRTDRGRGADEELADLPRPQLLDRLAPVEHLPDRALGVREENPAGVGERHTAAAAHEEVDPQVGLERLEPRRERGLREVERLRRAAHAGEPGDLGEGFELGEEHCAAKYR